MSETSLAANGHHNNRFFLLDSEATERFGAQVAHSLDKGGVIYLQGDLGAGKTTLVRGLLRALGFSGSIKSPTYTLVEPYEIGSLVAYHFDLYRLSDPEELEYIGIDDYFSFENAFFLIEWPEKGVGWIPEPQMIIELSYHDGGRQAQVHCESASMLTKLITLNNGRH